MSQGNAPAGDVPGPSPTPQPVASSSKLTAEREKRRISLRQSNWDVWQSGPQPPSGPLDSNMKKNTGFIKRVRQSLGVESKEQLIKEVEIIPLEIVVRNVAAGSLAKRLGIEEGVVLPRSIIEFYYKKDELNDPMVTEEHITAFNWASTQEIDDILATTVRVNDYLSGMFGAVGITLVDFKIEFGRIWENDFARVILADEISPDSCRLWDATTGEKLDKDRFRRDLGNVIESYAEVARRLGIMKDMPTVIQGGLH